MTEAAILRFPEPVACAQCGRKMEPKRMMRLEVTPAGGEPMVRLLCPPHASAFQRAWYEASR